jgi:hypothetical protein
MGFCGNVPLIFFLGFRGIINMGKSLHANENAGEKRKILRAG